MAIELLSIDAPEPHDRQRDCPRNPDEVIYRYPLVGSGNRRLECGAYLVELRADRNAKASLEHQLIGNLAGPAASGETTDEKGIGKLKASHQGMGHIGVDYRS